MESTRPRQVIDLPEWHLIRHAFLKQGRLFMIHDYGLKFGVFQFNQNCDSFYGKSYKASFPLLMHYDNEESMSTTGVLSVQILMRPSLIFFFLALSQNP
ncbi:hypothetical protein LINGRAHAP2_LOCUS983 [Linum grandiflorum]